MGLSGFDERESPQADCFTLDKMIKVKRIACSTRVSSKFSTLRFVR